MPASELEWTAEVVVNYWLLLAHRSSKQNSLAGSGHVLHFPGLCSATETISSLLSQLLSSHSHGGATFALNSYIGLWLHAHGVPVDQPVSAGTYRTIVCTVSEVLCSDSCRWWLSYVVCVFLCEFTSVNHN